MGAEESKPHGEVVDEYTVPPWHRSLEDSTWKDPCECCCLIWEGQLRRVLYTFEDGHRTLVTYSGGNCCDNIIGGLIFSILYTLTHAATSLRANGTRILLAYRG